MPINNFQTRGIDLTQYDSQTLDELNLDESELVNLVNHLSTKGAKNFRLGEAGCLGHTFTFDLGKKSYRVKALSKRCKLPELEEQINEEYGFLKLLGPALGQHIPEPITQLPLELARGFIMQNIDSVDLNEQLERGSWTYAEAVGYLSDLFDALCTMHSLGVIHRDLKPQNLLVRPDYTSVIIDFQLAAIDDCITTDEYPALHGTIGYMGLPQILGDKPSLSDDVFAVGAILYRMFSGSEFYSKRELFDLTKSFPDNMDKTHFDRMDHLVDEKCKILADKIGEHNPLNSLVRNCLLCEYGSMHEVKKAHAELLGLIRAQDPMFLYEKLGSPANYVFRIPAQIKLPHLQDFSPSQHSLPNPLHLYYTDVPIHLKQSKYGTR
jgi:serine/threonine protein kinase